MNMISGAFKKLLLGLFLPALLMVTGYEALAHDCNHDESHDTCALCAVSHTPAENSAPQIFDPPRNPELMVSVADVAALVSTLPRAHSPRSPPIL